MPDRYRHHLILLAAILASLGVWLYARPLMAVLGIWKVEDASELYRVQLLNVAYLIIVNGLWLGVILAAAGLWGWRVLGWLSPVSADESANREVRLQRRLMAIGLGILTLSLATFGLGILGCLQRGVFVALLGIMVLVGGWPLLRSRSQLSSAHLEPAEPFCWGAWPLVPLGSLALLAVLIPAGILWAHDGRGFDCLEYHLQLPREYLDAGRIFRIGHNAYSHFPQNAEMLYLLAMVLRGDAIEGMYLGQIINLSLGLTFLAGLHSLCRRWGRLPAWLAVAAVGGPQWFYVTTIAYVECYLLLMFVLALIALMPRVDGGLPGWRSCLLAGVFVGGACGGKYTALVMVVPVIVLFMLGLKKRLPHLVVFFGTTLVVFSPWLVKNLIWNGNPIFPLAARTLGPSDWTDEQLQRWQDGHSPHAQDATLSGRAGKLWAESVSVDRYAIPLGLAVLGGVLSLVRSRKPQNQPVWDRFLPVSFLGVAGVGLAWAATTHLQSRFLLPMAVPLGMLVAQVWQTLASKRLSHILLFAVGGLQLALCVNAFNGSTSGFAAQGGFYPLAGMDPLVARFYPFSDPRADHTQVKVLLVGESRPFYVQSRYDYNTAFDRCPFDELLAKATPHETLAWLAQNGYTHVYVRWDEIDRLRASYGFAPHLTRQALDDLEKNGLQPIPPSHDDLPASLARLYQVPSPSLNRF